VPVFFCDYGSLEVPDPTNMKLLALFFFGTIVCSLLLKLFCNSRISAALLDHPTRANAMHVTPMPQIGGLGILLTTLAIALACGALSQIALLTCAAAALVLISIFDDKLGLRVDMRLLAQVLATALALSHLLSPLTFLPGIGRPAETWLAILALPLAVIWLTNLFNFMDGADGLAAGMTLIGFGSYAIAAGEAPSGLLIANSLSVVSAIISGASLGFLFFNFPPAKVFMGDAGSIPLGFLAATLGIQGYFSNLWPWWFPILVFSPFIVDATVTLLKRVARREKIWLGHRQHAYQRLILSGWSHRRTALTYYALMLACAGSALWARHYAATPLFLWAWVIIYLLLFATVEIYLARKNKKKSEPL
jgi:UDP-GlcNAc:undecaprenyl-phosphate/decaprenyl-phosphate GlcNAc-1-phosphate transferase